MPRTVQDYASAIPLGPVVLPDYANWFPEVDVQRVEVRGRHVLATMLWSTYAHRVSHALLPEDVLLWGGDLPVEEATLDHWAEEAVLDLSWAAGLPLTSSRRAWAGDAIEVTETEPIDPRYTGGHLHGSAKPEEWHELAQHFEPRVPPPRVEQWRSDGSLISWHHVSLNHDRGRVLPVYGHGAVRWVEAGVASFDHLELSPGLPETFGLMTLAGAIHRAAAAGAHTIATTVEVPGIELVGFRDVGGSLEVDNRFLDLDYDGVASFVSRTSGWIPPEYIQRDIERANRANYFAG